MFTDRDNIQKNYDWAEEHPPGKFPGGFFLRKTKLWIQDPYYYIAEAIDLGFKRFAFNFSSAVGNGTEVLSFVRANCLHAGTDIRFVIVDRNGAAEYSMFSHYYKPLAVYPVWNSTDRMEDLVNLIENPVGEDERVYGNTDIPTNIRPVKGQPHRVFVRTGYIKANDAATREMEKSRVAVLISGVQKVYPNVKIVFCDSTRFDVLFGHGFAEASYRLHFEAEQSPWEPRMCLPNGRAIGFNEMYDPRFADWFELVGWNQEMLTNRRDRTRFALTSLDWASQYYNSITPFAHKGLGRNNILSPEFWESKSNDFKLPESRRTLMRNRKLNASEYDRFTCDTCILSNNCKLYRQGSVCVVKGSEGVSLADNFGTRNASVIIDGLVKLVEKQAKRLEDSLAAEEDTEEINPEVTKQFKSLFDQGVKLAKLIDPTLNGGPAVQVNVGVGTGGTASIVANANPKQVVASVVAELEKSGIRREDITSDMIKAVLQSMGEHGKEIASATVVVGGHVEKHDSPRALPSTPADDTSLQEYFGFGSDMVIDGNIVNG